MAVRRRTSRSTAAMSLPMVLGWLLPLEVSCTPLYLNPFSVLLLTRIFFLDGHVRVWSTEAIFNAADPDFPKPKQLASMSYHSGTIHTVRFSSNGRYLASGADDKIVCVYTLDPTPPSHAATFGTSLEQELAARTTLTDL